MPATKASGRVSSNANQMSPPAALFELAERRERHDAAMLDTKPLALMLAVDVADVGGAAIGLHPPEVDRLVFALRTSQRAFLPPASVRTATTARPQRHGVNSRLPSGSLRTMGTTCSQKHSVRSAVPTVGHFVRQPAATPAFQNAMVRLAAAILC
jgi:hypothetical protein